MQPVTHTYPLITRVMNRWFLLISLSLALIYLFVALPPGSKLVGLPIAALVLSMVAWYWNFQPEIVANKDGLLVHFFFWWLPVKWEDIVDVRPHFLIKVLRKVVRLRGTATFVVRTRSLTFFHRFYFYPTVSFLPSFAIFRNISGFDELLSFMKKYIPEKMES